MAEPANCTFRPLSTPPVLPPPEPPPVDPSELAPASTPSEADDGPVEMLLFTLRSNAPALARMQVGLLQFGIEARHFDIQIVLQRQRDGIAQGQVDAAGAHQPLDPLRILETDAGHRGRAGSSG